jgi:uncharacterized protein (TIGR03437 family)
MWVKRFLGAAAIITAAFGQVSNNASLTGKYNFRQILLVTDGVSVAVNVTDMRSGAGTITFDGAGNFTVSGQEIVGNSPPGVLAGSGTYQVKPGGFTTLSSPLRQGSTINARVGNGALMGSSTETSPSVFDLFVAIPAPTQATSMSTLNGAYWISSLELPGDTIANIRDTNFKLTSNGTGSFAESTVTGQAANLANHLQNQTVGPMTYSIAADGSGALTFPLAAGLTGATQLISGVKNIYISQDGSYFIGGSTAAGLHGLVVGVKAASADTNASWNGFYFAAGMRYDAPSVDFPSARLASVSGSVHPTGDGNSIWARRTRQSDGLFDAAPLITYSLTADGSGAYTSTPGHVTLASGGVRFATSGVGTADALSYEIYFGAAMPAQSGSGVFLNPQGIFNAASFAPPGYPVSPGEFITLYGTGLGTQSGVAKSFPFPPTLAGVQLTVNGITAPIYSVSTASPAQISAIVPYGVSGSTATFVVTVNNVKSNAVDLPLAPTSPGIFSLSQSGIGDAAVRHLDYTVVNSASPAARGEYVSIYLSGLGATNPSVADGAAAPGSAPFALVAGPLNVYVGGVPVTNVQFAGLAPTLAGLYQINIQIPVDVDSGSQGLAIQTNDGFTDLVNIFIK